MAVIDEKGRLFGVVNVIDALVLLLLLAVIVAGVALVVGGEDEDPEPDPTAETRYGTLAFTVPMESDVASIERGETLSARSGEEELAVEDVYRSFSHNGSVHVVAKVSYNGSLTTGGAVRYGGDAVELRTESYAFRADVLAVDEEEMTIPTRTERVVLLANVSRATASGVDVGDTATIGDTEVATVTAIEERSRSDDRTRLAVGVELTVWDREPVATYNGTPLRLGNRITIVTDRTLLSGEIGAIGTDDPATIDDE